MKLTTDRPFAKPEKAARRLMQHAHAFEVVQDGRIYIEKLNGPFLYVDRGKPEEYAAGLALAVERGCWHHEGDRAEVLPTDGQELLATIAPIGQRMRKHFSL